MLECHQVIKRTCGFIPHGENHKSRFVDGVAVTEAILLMVGVERAHVVESFFVYHNHGSGGIIVSECAVDGEVGLPLNF